MSNSRYYATLIGVWFAAWLAIFPVTRGWVAVLAASGVMLAAAWLLTFGCDWLRRQR